MSPELTAAAPPLPFLTADQPGIGGRIKRFNEDFLVEELPLYPAGGIGTHTYLTIEKQGMTTLAAVGQLARALGRPPRDIGYAGLKDAHGITRQTLSVEHVTPERIAALSLPRMRILSVNHHTNKIKLGHLRGNRFHLRIRDVAADARTVQRARKIVEILQRRGVPNYFGPQRFGARGDNAAVGRAILHDDFVEAVALLLGRPGPYDHGPVRHARELFDQGDLAADANACPPHFREQKRVSHAVITSNGDAQRAWHAVDHTLRKLYYSALQSELFNRVVALRIDTIDQILVGDLACKHANGACFRVEDAAAEQPRCTALEISATGPLFGRRMTEAQGEPGRWEEQVLVEAGLTRDRFVSRDGTRFEGGRRPIRIPLGAAQVESGEDENGPYLSLAFELPAGAYATNVTREVCKSDD